MLAALHLQRLQTDRQTDRWSELKCCFCSSPPAQADVDSAHRKWDHLHARLLALEESWLLPPPEVRPRRQRTEVLLHSQTHKKKRKPVFLHAWLSALSRRHFVASLLLWKLLQPHVSQTSDVSLSSFSFLFVISRLRWQTHLWGAVMEQQDVRSAHKLWLSFKPTSSTWESWDTQRQSVRIRCRLTAS